MSSYHGYLPAFAKEHHLDYEHFLNQLKKLGLEREAFKQKIEEMSQGQKKRVALAKSLTEEASLYLWDEPANYLDLFNQDQLIKLMAKEQPAMLLVDHDQAFIEAVAKKESTCGRSYNLQKRPSCLKIYIKLMIAFYLILLL